MAVFSIQKHYKIGENDNANADLCSFDALDTGRTGQEKRVPFMVRTQIVNTGDTPQGGDWRLFYNDTDDIATAVRVGTALDGTIQVDSVTGLPTDESALEIDDVVFDSTGTQTWINGKYDDQNASTEELIIVNEYYSDFQYCIEFTEIAQDNKIYYFYMVIDTSIEMDEYAFVAQVKTIHAILGETELCHTIENQPSLTGTVTIPECEINK